MTPYLEEIASWNWWLIAALLVASAELLAPGIYLLWIAAALALTGVLHIFYPLGLGEGFLALGLFTPLTLYVGHRIYQSSGSRGGEGRRLNARAEQHLGRRLRLKEPLRMGEESTIELGGLLWKIEGPDMEEGQMVEIHAVRGGVFQVRPF